MNATLLAQTTMNALESGKVMRLRPRFGCIDSVKSALSKKRIEYGKWNLFQKEE